MFKLKKERINFKKKIGSGASGTVYPYQKDSNDLKWVVKRMHADDSDKLLNILPEIVLGFSCDHPCVLPLKGYSIEKGEQEDYYIFLKFPRMKETLKDKADELKKSNRQFSEEEIVRYFYSMVCAVEYLHKKKIYHRDIKPGNVLLDENGNAMLSDVGVAKHVGEEEIYQPLTGQGGTVDYTAPELLKDKSKLTKESLIAGDAWSLGLVILELCALKNRLFNPYSIPERIEEIQKCLYDKLKEIYSKKLLELILSLLKFEPNERIKIADLKKKLEDEYHVNTVDHTERIGVQIENDKRINQYTAEEELRLLVESLKKENLQQQNDLKKYRYFISQLKSEIFSGLDMSESEVIEKVLANYQDSLKKLKESEGILRNQSLAQIKEPDDEEEKKEPQDIVSLGTIPNGNQLQSQRVVGLSRLEIKVILAGRAACGKSNIASRLTSKPFNESYSATIGASYSQLDLNQDGKTLVLRIWDTSGQEKMKDMMGLYFKASSVAIIVYDITVRRSFDDIPEWIKLHTKHAGGPTIILIVGTKLDRWNERKVSKEEAEALARQHGGISIEVSARTGENIDELREQVVSAILENYNSLSTSTVQVTEQRRSTFWGLFG